MLAFGILIILAAKPDSGTSPGLFFGLAILVVAATVGLIVL